MALLVVHEKIRVSPQPAAQVHARARGAAVVAEREVAGREAGVTRAAFNYTMLPALRDSGAFERTVAHRSPESLLVSTGGMPVRTNLAFATRDFLDVPGVNPLQPD